MPASDPDWLALCRRAASRVRRALERYGTTAERAVETGRGEGGDTALVIDRAAEDEVLAELEALGAPLTVVSEERGELALGGGGPVRVVVDPVDGSLNAKRGLPLACVSIAVAGGGAMDDVGFAYVATLEGTAEWWAARGRGAWRDGERLERLEPGPLELVALETARPGLVADAAGALRSLEARRLRALGSVAVSLCLVGDGRLDGMVSLRAVRSVDAAAGQLVAREAGAAVAFPEAGDGAAGLGLEMRSRVLAARDPAALARLRAAFG